MTSQRRGALLCSALCLLTSAAWAASDAGKDPTDPGVAEAQSPLSRIPRAPPNDLPMPRPFASPLVANGRVYVGSQKEVTVWGLAP